MSSCIQAKYNMKTEITMTRLGKSLFNELNEKRTTNSLNRLTKREFLALSEAQRARLLYEVECIIHHATPRADAEPDVMDMKSVDQ